MRQEGFQPPAQDDADLALCQTHYHVLGLLDHSQVHVPTFEQVTTEQVKKAFRTLALELHVGPPHARLSPDPGPACPRACVCAASDYMPGVHGRQPDKSGGSAAARARFERVQRAYETLRDETRRQEYDRFVRRQQQAQHVVCWQELGLDELDPVRDQGASQSPHGDGAAPQGSAYTYECRCGDEYLVNTLDFEALGCDHLIAWCRSCSLCIRVSR
eukprot:scaffold2425_cov306-Prasinococcus_capsulatus_cf.AAC.2